jgi:hypothetical protein
MNDSTFSEFLGGAFPDYREPNRLEIASKEWNITYCGNVLQCRAMKYICYLNISTWVPHFQVRQKGIEGQSLPQSVLLPCSSLLASPSPMYLQFVRHEDIQNPKDAMAWLEMMKAKWGISLKENMTHIGEKYRGPYNDVSTGKRGGGAGGEWVPTRGMFRPGGIRRL